MSDLKCKCCGALLDRESISFPLIVKEATDGFTLKDKLIECIPELHIKADTKEVICVNCYALLTSAYNFRKMCLKVNTEMCELEKVAGSIKEIVEFEELPIKEEEPYEVDNNDDDNCLEKCKVSLNILPQEIINSATTGNIIFVCDYCKSLFLYQENYLEHVSKEPRCCGKCLECNVSFRSNVIYEMHMKFMHSENFGIYKLKDTQREDPPHRIRRKKCDDSPTLQKTSVKKIISTDDSLNISKRNTERRSNIFKEIKCVLCKQTCPPSHMQQHLRIHESYCYRCLKCNRFEINKEHHRRCNSTEFVPPSFTDTRCPFCFKYYATVSDLQQHFMQYSDFRKYCFVCRINVQTVWELALHHIVNNCGSTQFLTRFLGNREDMICPLCLKTFMLRKNLRQHFLTHRNNTTVCSICESLFYDKELFSEHFKCCYKVPKVTIKQTEEGIATMQTKENTVTMQTEEDITMQTKEEEKPEFNMVCVKEERDAGIEPEEVESNMKVGTSNQDNQIDPLVLDTAEVSSVSVEEPHNANIPIEPENSTLVKEITENFQNIIAKIKTDQLLQIPQNSDIEIATNEEINPAANVLSSTLETEAEETEVVSSTT